MSSSSADAVANTDDFMRVSSAKKRYFGGAMSLRWWYKQIELGRLPHYRAGGAVLLRPADVEAFVAKMFREEAKPEPKEPIAPAPATRRRSHRAPGGLRFFPDDN